MKKKIILLVGFFIFNAVVFAQEGDAEIRYIASITSDFKNGSNLELQMQTEKWYSTGGYTIEFRHEDYGYFHTFGPFIQMPSGLHTLGSSPARGELSLRKDESYHFIFFVGEKSGKIKEEFLITVEKGIIKVKSLSDTKYVTFEPREIRVFPDNTLTIVMGGGLTIDNVVKKMLKEIGCEPLVLPLGDYGCGARGCYEILGYSKTDKYAHRTSQTDKAFYYYYEIKDNYEKIDNILKENRVIKESLLKKYTHYYNFDIKKRIEYEKNPIAFAEMKVSQLPPYMQSQRLDDIKFHLDKPASVMIKITNTEGEKIEEIKMDIESAGTVNYKWDGILKDGTKAKSGVYMYQVLLEEKTIKIGFFSLK
jgi:hypothetical protein